MWLLFLPGALGGLVNAAAVTSRADTAKDLPAFILALAIAAGLAAAAVNGAAWGALLALSIEAAWKFPGRVPSGLSRAGWSFFGGMLSGRFCMACMVGILRLFTPAV